MGSFKDLTGQVFERLTVVDVAGKNKGGAYLWNCKCSCGNSITTLSRSLISGNTRSCGCLQREAATANAKHGFSDWPEYSNWRSMLHRCLSPNSKDHKNYADRGISVHTDFIDDFMAFYNEIGKKPADGKKWSIGRIDNNGWYTYGNIRWETTRQQTRNRTMSCRNTSGTMGVRLSVMEKNGKIYEYYVAQWINMQGKQRAKSFNISTYGAEKAKQLAVDYRNMKIKELNSLGAGYADSHGSEK